VCVNKIYLDENRFQWSEFWLCLETFIFTETREFDIPLCKNKTIKSFQRLNHHVLLYILRTMIQRIIHLPSTETDLSFYF